MDNGNNVYVADLNNNRIEKFAAMATYLTQWGSGGGGSGQFEGPEGVAVDSSGNYVYEGEGGNNRIEVFVNDINIAPPIITAQPRTKLQWGHECDF